MPGLVCALSTFHFACGCSILDGSDETINERFCFVNCQVGHKIISQYHISEFLSGKLQNNVPIWFWIVYLKSRTRYLRNKYYVLR